MNAMQNFSDLVSYATAETHFVDVASIAASGAEAETSIEPVKKRMSSFPKRQTV